MPHESTRSFRIYFEIFFKWSCIRTCHKGVLSVIRYRFCWIGAYPHNWVWKRLELSKYLCGSLISLCWLNRTHFWNLLSALFSTLCLSEMFFLFINFLISSFESTFFFLQISHNEQQRPDQHQRWKAMEVRHSRKSVSNNEKWILTRLTSKTCILTRLSDNLLKLELTKVRTPRRRKPE